MKQKNRKDRGKLTKFKVLSRLMYAVAIVAILIIIPSCSKIFYDYYYNLSRQQGYRVEELYQSFINKQYGELIQKVDYNTGLGRKITSDDEQYYAFARCYDSAMDYHMYAKTNQNELAETALKEFRANEGTIRSRIFVDALESVKNTYQIP